MANKRTFLLSAQKSSAVIYWRHLPFNGMGKTNVYNTIPGKRSFESAITN